MSQEQSQKEATKDMLRAVIAAEIGKSNKRLWVKCASIAMITAIVVSAASLFGANTTHHHNASPLPERGMTHGTAFQYSKERIVASTTALMVMADNQISQQELDYALSVVSRRQAGMLGNQIQFIPDGSEWLDSQTTLAYFSQALSYLNTGEEKFLVGLKSDYPSYTEKLSLNADATSAIDKKRAIYTIMSIIQGDIDKESGHDAYLDVYRLANNWMSFKDAEQEDLGQHNGAHYMAMLDKITQTLKYNQSNGQK